MNEQKDLNKIGLKEIKTDSIGVQEPETQASLNSISIPDKRIPNIEELLKSGVHFGHQKGRWNPRANSYIYGERNGVHIIDLQETLKGLEKALEEVNRISKKKGKILFVGTKKQARDLIEEAAKTTNMPYVIERWLGGTFTNFSTISRRINKLLDIETKQKEGKLSHYSKKEQMQFKKELEDFEKNMGGLRDMKELPDAIFVVGMKEEKIALTEANKSGVKIIALVDTNVDPKNIDFPIPANDDAVKSIKLILSYIIREMREASK